jgi:hypothetical protein
MFNPELVVNMSVHIMLYLIVFGTGFWLIKSAGWIEDTSIINLAKAMSGFVMILFSFGIVIHGSLDLAKYLELI